MIKISKWTKNTHGILEMLFVIEVVDKFIMALKMDIAYIKNRVMVLEKVIFWECRYNGKNIFLVKKG